MPPRYAYWTIIIDDAPTAFRAREREELLPTFKQLASRNPNAAIKWFSRGRLWESPEQARAALAPPREPRGKDWRPGGRHEDPRARFKQKRDANKRRPQGPRERDGAEAPAYKDAKAGARRPDRSPNATTPRRDRRDGREARRVGQSGTARPDWRQPRPQGQSGPPRPDRPDTGPSGHGAPSSHPKSAGRGSSPAGRPAGDRRPQGQNQWGSRPPGRPSNSSTGKQRPQGASAKQRGPGAKPWGAQGKRDQQDRKWGEKRHGKKPQGDKKRWERGAGPGSGQPTEPEPPAPPPPEPPGPDRPPRPGQEPRPDTPGGETIKILPDSPERASHD